MADALHRFVLVVGELEDFDTDVVEVGRVNDVDSAQHFFLVVGESLVGVAGIAFVPDILDLIVGFVVHRLLILVAGGKTEA